MKKIISIRVEPEDSSKRGEFIRGTDGTVKNKIVNIINKDNTSNYDFLIDDDGSKYIKSAMDLAGEVVNIIDDTCIAYFTEEDGEIEILVSSYESLVQKHTLDQLKMVRSKSRGTDIGDRISDMNRQGANIQYIQNPIDSGIETQQDFENNNKLFQPNWNLKRLRPFHDYQFKQSTSNTTGRKKRKNESVSIDPDFVICDQSCFEKVKSLYPECTAFSTNSSLISRLKTLISNSNTSSILVIYDDTIGTDKRNRERVSFISEFVGRGNYEIKGISEI